MWETIKTGLRAADRAFEKSGSALIIVGISVVTVTVVVQVVMRYILKLPLFGLEEFSRLIAVWIYFLGAIFGTREDSHVQGDVAARLFKSERSRSVLKVVTWTLSMVVCLLFLYHSGKYSIWLYGTGERTTGLWWPRIYSVGSMFFGAALMTVYTVVNVFKHLEATIGLWGASAGGES